MIKNTINKLTSSLVLLICCIGYLGINSSSAAELKATSLDVQKMEFSQSGTSLNHFDSPLSKVYLQNIDHPLNIYVEVNAIDFDGKDILSIIHTPSGTNGKFTPLEKNSDVYIAEINVEEIHLGENSLSIRRTNANNDNIYSPLFVPFTLDEEVNSPSYSGLVSEILTNELVILLLVILIVSFIIIYSNKKDQAKWIKVLTTLILIIEVMFIIVVTSQQFLQKALEKGLIENDSLYNLSLQENELKEDIMTLTKLDENGSLKASLANSWSNISPLVWEFSLDKEVHIDQVIREIQEKSKVPVIKQLLSSVSKIIATPTHQIQFLMNSPDPLLAHKLTQIEISSHREESTEIKRKASSSSISYDSEKNTMNESLQLSIEQQKEYIERKSPDSIIEPNPALWPILFQNEYRIIPEVNSISISIILNRSHEIFSELENIEILRNELQSGAVLQTSYLQYGQLATQFASPGVTGYDPELIIPVKNSKKAINKELIEEKTPIIFRYPAGQRQLASVVEAKLGMFDTEIFSYSYEPQTLQKILIEEETDLLLLEYDFILGDVGPFLETYAESSSVFNNFYTNKKVDSLISKARKELNQYERLTMLQEIMHIIVLEDPLGIPLLYKRSFSAGKEDEELSIKEKAFNWLLSF